MSKKDDYIRQLRDELFVGLSASKLPYGVLAIGVLNFYQFIHQAGKESEDAFWEVMTNDPNYDRKIMMALKKFITETFPEYWKTMKLNPAPISFQDMPDSYN